MSSQIQDVYVLNFKGLVIPDWDDMVPSYGTTIDTFVYRKDSVIVSTVYVEYTNSTKDVLAHVWQE